MLKVICDACLIFVLVSFGGRILVDQTCEIILKKYIKKYGYLPVRNNEETIEFIDHMNKHIRKFCTPATNIKQIIEEINLTIYILTRKGEEREKIFHEAISEYHCTTLKQVVNEQDELLKNTMSLDDASQDKINKEYEKKPFSSDYKITEKQRKTLDAMNEAELWLTTIQMDIGLTEKEKKELFMDYVKDFQNTKETIKPKAIQKTLKMIEKREK